MTVNFNFQDVSITEFGVGREGENGDSFVLVPVDTDVQVVLHEMAIATREEMNEIGSADSPVYEPSKKYGSSEYIHLPLQDEMASQLRTYSSGKESACRFKRTIRSIQRLLLLRAHDGRQGASPNRPSACKSI